MEQLKEVNLKKISISILAAIIVVCILSVVFIPIVFNVTASFLIPSFYENYINVKDLNYYKLFASEFSFTQYFDNVLNSSFTRSFVNTLFYAFSSSILSLIISLPAAYAISKFHPRFEGLFIIISVAVMMTPAIAVSVPNYLIFDKIGILNSPAAMILPGIFSGFSIFIFRQFMADVPDDILYAASIDGAGSFVIFVKIMIPQIKNCIFSVFILIFSQSCSMTEQPAIFLKNDMWKPISIYLNQEFSLKPEKIIAPGVIVITLFSIITVLSRRVFTISGYEILKDDEFSFKQE